MDIIKSNANTNNTELIIPKKYLGRIPSDVTREFTTNVWKLLETITPKPQDVFRIDFTKTMFVIRPIDNNSTTLRRWKQGSRLIFDRVTIEKFTTYVDDKLRSDALKKQKKDFWAEMELLLQDCFRMINSKIEEAKAIADSPSEWRRTGAYLLTTNDNKALIMLHFPEIVVTISQNKAIDYSSNGKLSFENLNEGHQQVAKLQGNIDRVKYIIEEFITTIPIEFWR